MFLYDATAVTFLGPNGFYTMQPQLFCFLVLWVLYNSNAAYFAGSWKFVYDATAVRVAGPNVGFCTIPPL